MSATENQTPALPEADRPGPGTSAEFLRPTLLGIGIGTAAVALLVVVLLLLALAADREGRAAGNGGNAAARWAAFAPSGSRGAQKAPADDLVPGANSVEPAETSVGNAESDADRRSQTAASSTETDHQEQIARLSSFSIASLSDSASGQESESEGSGSRFADVGDRLDSAGAKSGEVQISLAWNSVNDLDLHVITPSGERIYYDHRNSACAGELDVDMNAGGPDSDRPVENVYWPVGRAPRGEYRVQVHHYANHGSPDPTNFQVVVKVDGRTRTFTGKTSCDGKPPVDVHRFTRR